jgi:hypothetical protein
LRPYDFGVPDLAVQFPIGEQACAAFAELHVRFGGEDALAPQVPGVLGAPSYFATALEHNGFEAHLRQQQRSEQAAGSKAHNHRSIRKRSRGLRDGMVGGVGRRTNVLISCEAFHDGRLVAHPDIQDVDEADDAVFLARIEAALEHREIDHVRVAQPEPPHDGGTQRVGRVVEG